MNNILLDVSYIISIIIEVVLPFVLGFFIWKKYRVSWSIFFLGMVFFLISLTRLPLNNYINSLILDNFVGDTAVMLAGLFMSLTAGLFEEGVRIIVFGLIIKQKNYQKGIMYGIGHGGGESAILVGMSLLASFLAYKFFPGSLPGSTLAQLTNIDWYMPLIGALERIFAIFIQISLSVLVINAFIRRKKYFILIAISYHVLVDFVSVYTNYIYGVITAEILILIFAVISIIIIYVLKPKKEKQTTG